MRKNNSHSIFWTFFLFIQAFGFCFGNNSQLIRKSLARIVVTTQTPAYRAPWNPGSIGGGVGSGFVVSGSKIMTNAHVVSNARFINVEKYGDPQKYRAKVLHIAHDCDLALLEVKDSGFFDNMTALEFGEIPELHSTVTAYGFPIGGSKMSVTRGVVSRIEFRTYSHSGLDSHLAAQIDAAINPGNSGGPVMQEGKVVGVAFQGYSGAVAQNTGYMIPTPVIKRFLTDIQDGKYDGYVELGIEYLNLQNPNFRKFLNLPDDNRGVVVTNVLAAGSANSYLKNGDVLLTIENFPINSDGNIEIDGEYLHMEEVVERKFHGDKVGFEIIRNGTEITVDIVLKGAWPYGIFAHKYDEQPQFVLFAGLLFQPLTRNFLGAYKNKDVDLNYYYSYYVSEELYLERPQIVVLSSILPDPINTYWGRFVNSIVDEIDGQKIRTLKDVATVFDEKKEHYVLKMLGKEMPIVIENSQVAPALSRIKTRYGVITDRYLGN